MLEIIKNSNIDFVGKRKIALTISAILILFGIFSLIFRGGIHYSIDFEGGSLIQVRFDTDVQVAQVRDAMTTIGKGDAIIQRFGDENEFLIRIKSVENADENTAAVQSALSAINGEDGYEIRRSETVGPKIGKELRGDALSAILIAMLGIVIYISIRFQFMYAIGALVALVHDVLIVLGTFSELNMEISLTVIAAFLTIVGYSLNDTIVVFDRIRENVNTMRRETYKNVVNISINETLNRTLITSGTTLLAVITLYAIGGEVIRPFAFALIIGVLIGTYSSIFIASPILIAWQGRQAKKAK
ncbi:MAG: protein translocase subunit SecF [Candidatus Marinimicrobia bacterium]|nr:protein translocase subunit SecF [Candidatus Neomarinimicrobiota bacterium]MCF7839485.1 protein translocase subunit SecF [Candidatus Neomarinimicrobiota bacterium]MCF7902281.1 protein translocase subunit SecF [Candidatus Neomarinimicrobiota bacterium]